MLMTRAQGHDTARNTTARYIHSDGTNAKDASRRETTNGTATNSTAHKVTAGVYILAKRRMNVSAGALCALASSTIFIMRTTALSS